MATRINTLELNIKTTATGSTKAINDIIAKLSSLQSAVNKFNAGKITKEFEKVTKGVESISGENAPSPAKAMGEFNKGTRDATLSLANFNTSLKNVNTGFGKLFKAIGRIAVYRLIRTAIKDLTKSISDGMQNLVKYEQAWGGLKGIHATETMTALRTELLLVKNSMGAMATAVLASILPAIQQLCTWLIRGVELINQFFVALMGGGTYKKAKKTIDDVTKSLAGAKKQLDLLGFDELNRLSDPNSGSGSSANISDMFEDGKVDENIQAFADKIKPFIDWVRNNLDEILRVAKAIGIAILGWKIAQAFFKGLETAQTLINKILDDNVGKNIEIGLALVGAIIFEQSLKDALDNGLDAVNAFGIEFGATMTGLFMAVSLGASATLGGIVGAVIGALALIVIYCYQHWDEIKKWLDGVQTKFENVIIKIKVKFSEFVNHCIDNINTIIRAINKLISGMNNVLGTQFELKGEINHIAENSLSKKENFKLNQTKDFFASGGTPDVGSLFWAGEDGAELIAQVGGRSTVFNSDQLGSAMLNANAPLIDGVNALLQAVREGKVITLDGDKVGQSGVNYQNSQSRRFNRSVTV